MSEYLDLNLHGTEKDDNILSSEVELFFQEIELAIKMEPTAVYGHYGTFSLQNYVFTQFANETDIISTVTEHIKNNCYHSYLFNWNVDCLIQEQTIIIQFNVVDVKTSEKFKKTFLIEN